jgi:hypothetical protein
MDIPLILMEGLRAKCSHQLGKFDSQVEIGFMVLL